MWESGDGHHLRYGSGPPGVNRNGLKQSDDPFDTPIPTRADGETTISYNGSGDLGARPGDIHDIDVFLDGSEGVVSRFAEHFVRVRVDRKYLVAPGLEGLRDPVCVPAVKTPSRSKRNFHNVTTMYLLMGG